MKRLLVVVALIALLVPATLWAQGELTLEGLAELLGKLTERVDSNEERLAAIETAIAPTPTPTMTATPQIQAIPPTPTPTSTSTPRSATTYARYTAKQIFDDYEANAARAEATYLDKTIEVTGTIVDVEKKGGGFFSGPERYEVTLDGEGFLRYLDCDFSLTRAPEVLALSAGQTVTLRGRVDFASTVSVRMKDCRVVQE